MQLLLEGHNIQPISAHQQERFNLGVSVGLQIGDGEEKLDSGVVAGWHQRDLQFEPIFPYGLCQNKVGRVGEHEGFVTERRLVTGMSSSASVALTKSLLEGERNVEPLSER